MTRETGQFEGGTGESSRRTFVTRGSLLASGLALGLSGSSHPLQVDGEGEDDQQAMMYRSDFRPGATIRVISPVIDWRPVGEDPLFEPDLFDDFGTRAILYVDEGDGGQENGGSNGTEGTENGRGGDAETESPRFFFPSDDAEVQEDQLYELGEDARPIGEAEDLLGDVVADNPDAGQGLVVVTFTGVASTPTPAETTDGTPTPEGTPTEDG